MRPGEDRYRRLVAAAEPRPFWLDQPGAPPARAALRGATAADLVVIGGGFTGLWTALVAKESFPERSGVLVEGHRVGWAASGRNGGFCDASLTHGAVNGRERFGAEVGVLREAAQRDGATFLDASAMRAEVDSPSYLAGLWGTAMIQPARLAWGLATSAFPALLHRLRPYIVPVYGIRAARARVMLDLLSGEPTELTGLRLVRSKPVPFPPEPLAYLGIQATRWSLARADRHDGRRNLWLRALDAAGLGFDS